MKVQKILILLIILIISFANVAIATDSTNTTENNTIEEYITTTAEEEIIEQEVVEEETKWTDFSKVKAEFVNKNVSEFPEYDLAFKDVKFADEGTRYYVFISNSSEKPEFGSTIQEMNSNATFILYSKSDGIIPSSVATKVIDTNGNSIYIWIIESKISNESEYKEVLSAKKVEKPALKKIGTRLQAFFFSNRTSTFLHEPYTYSNARKINIKIGKVTDNKLLRSIKNQEANSLDNLMSYAKTSNHIYTGTINLGDSDTITNKFSLVNGEYYYVYMEMDNENGKYRKIEDISLYQGWCDAVIGDNLFDYLSSEFKWNIKEEPVAPPTENIVDNTTINKPIPNAGKTSIIMISICIISVIGVIYLVQYKKYEGIK